MSISKQTTGANNATNPEGGDALKGAALTDRLRRLDGWEVVNKHHLHKEYRFPDFVTALAFVNRIGELAESAGHHPDLALSWGKVGVQLFTHSEGGLTDADFRLAADIDGLPH